MTVQLRLRKETYQIKPGMTLRDSLLKLNINPETVLATRDGTLLTDDEILKDGEVINLVPVISGG
jgi:sulfur carrier protein ThiS